MVFIDKFSRNVLALGSSSAADLVTGRTYSPQIHLGDLD